MKKCRKTEKVEGGGPIILAAVHARAITIQLKEVGHEERVSVAGSDACAALACGGRFPCGRAHPSRWSTTLRVAQTLRGSASSSPSSEQANTASELTVSVNDDPYRVKLLQDIAAGNMADVASATAKLLNLTRLRAGPADKVYASFREVSGFRRQGCHVGRHVQAIWFHTGPRTVLPQGPPEERATKIRRTWSE
jgi:hypothetical protein